MLSRRPRRAVVLVAALSAVLMLSAGPATAATAKVTGGRTTVTTAKGIAGVLLATASFPVTGGSASLNPLAGQVLHRGGIRFIKLHNGKSLKVGDLTIDLSTGVLTGTVNNTSTRVPVCSRAASTSAPP